MYNTSPVNAFKRFQQLLLLLLSDCIGHRTTGRNIYTVQNCSDYNPRQFGFGLGGRGLYPGMIAQITNDISRIRKT